jgi:hypothetical protein
MVPNLFAADSFRLWPEQKAPAGIISLSTADCRAPVLAGGGQRDENLILAQSLAGLTSLAVNEGRLDELVYILEEGNPHYALWRTRLLARTGIEDRGQTNLWALIERYKGKGVCDGYILYHADRSVGDTHTCRPGSDESVNVATTAAGLLRGLVVSEALEPAAKAAGLKCLLDVRGKSELWAFEHFRDRLNRRGVLLQDPRLWFGRGTAIANRFFCMYGLDAPAEPVYDWMDTPGLVFGWNDGRHEQESVLQLCERGHVISASDWELNLSVLSIGSSGYRAKPFQTPMRVGDKPSSGPAVAFCMSDGDNLQWMLRDFVKNDTYWGAPEHGAFPFGWSLPVADLLETGVDIYGQLQETRPARSGVIMMTEYFFPDRYGDKLAPGPRRVLLRKLGARAERALVASGADILGFLAMDLEAPATRENLETMAAAMPSLGAIFVWAYHPYEAGNGKVMWIQGAKGEIPLITCKYSLWSGRKEPRAGTPAKLAREINEDAKVGGKDYLAWGIVHAWSGFKAHAGSDEAAETGKFLAPGTKAGVAPTEWCVKRLDPAIQVVPPAELVRRIKAQRVNGCGLKSDSLSP